MKRQLLLISTAALLALAAPAAATAQSGYGNPACERQKASDRTAGMLVGAVAGGLIGGAIGNNIDDDDDDYWHRGHRGYRGYRGYRGHRGYRHHRRHHRDNDNSDEVVAGAVIGAILGGVAGAAIAEDTGRDCQTVYPDHRNAPYRQDGSIPRTTHGLYGGPEMAPQTGYPHNPPPARTYPVSSTPGAPLGTPGPTEPYAYGGAPAPDYVGRECRTVFSETRLPDGQIISNPVTVCREGGEETWAIVNDEVDLYGY